MATDQGPVVQSAMLRTELLQLRRDQNMTQETVARALDWHPSKLIRIEGGKSRITKTDLQALLRQYGVVSTHRQERLEALAQGARGTAWWDEYRDVIDEATISYIGHEPGAVVLRQFENALIPGLLQTREYATAVVSHFVKDRKDRSVERLVALRMRRQEAMRGRDQPPRQEFIVDEAAIRRHIGMRTDTQIMARQLRRILNLVEGDELVGVRIVPFSAGAYAGLGGPFVLVEFDKGLNDVLYVEVPSALQAHSTFTSDNDSVSTYRDAFEAIAEDALSADESAALIGKIAEEFEAAG